MSGGCIGILLFFYVFSIKKVGVRMTDGKVGVRCVVKVRCRCLFLSYYIIEGLRRK